MNIILKTKFGSSLYGTQTPTSDIDIKGIFLPTLEDVILQSVAKAVSFDTNKSGEKNSPDDIDEEYYSLHYFLKLAQKGETVALDMIHVAPEMNLIMNRTHNKEIFDNLESHAYSYLGLLYKIWSFIYENRAKFYTKNMRSFLGYCKTQAAKYGIKGSRLNDAKRVIDFLKYDVKHGDMRIRDVWDQFPEGEHIKKMTIDNAKNNDNRAIEVCNRKIMAETKVWYAIDMVQQFYDSYGARALMAAKNEGIDWKAISHAFRAGYQLKEIYETGDLIYPLKDAEFLKEIKQGKYHYKEDGIAEKLEDLVDEVEALANASNYPEKVDMTFWNEWLLSLYK